MNKHTQWIVMRSTRMIRGRSGSVSDDNQKRSQKRIKNNI